jgi:hypothetical protein
VRKKGSDNGGSNTSVQGATENQEEVVDNSEAEESPVKSTRGKKKSTASNTGARGGIRTN